MNVSRLSLRHAAVCVLDLDRSQRFFIEHLGFSAYHVSDPDWRMLQSEGTTLSLVRVGKKEPVSPASARSGHPAHVGLVAQSRSEMKALHERLKVVEGVTVGAVEQHRDRSEGFYFKDFDGNQFELIFIPYETSGADLKHALILIAHGSRDARWRLPLEKLKETVGRHTSRPLGLCYMEFCSPTLLETVANFRKSGIESFEIVPVFLSSGAHVAEDIPRLIEECRKQNPNCMFELRAAVGESDAVREAMAAVILR